MLFDSGFYYGSGHDLEGEKFLFAVNRRLECDYFAVKVYQTGSNSLSRKRLCSGRGGILLGSRIGN